MLTFKTKDRVPITILHFCDGDTIKARVHCPTCHCSQEQYIRLRGIESYELRSPDKEKAKVIADTWTKQFRNVDAELILNQTGSDRYGRIIGTVYIGDKSLADMLVTANAAWYHDHKKR